MSFWLVLALVLVIPLSRHVDGLAGLNSFLPSPTESPFSVDERLGRLSASHVWTLVVTLSLTVGGLCWGGVAWFALTLVVAIVTLLGRANGHGVALGAHYAFTYLPFLMLASSEGAARLHRARPVVLQAVSACLLIGTLADSPLWRESATRVSAAARSRIEEGLRGLPVGASVAAMPNLVPHLAHRSQIWTLGEGFPRGDAEYVVITREGDLWPFDVEGVDAMVARYERDPRFVREASGPLIVFRRLAAAP
ncbi:MAG: DUF2079 domain-containing protein [Vicinamibacterales bacterium]